MVDDSKTGFTPCTDGVVRYTSDFTFTCICNYTNNQSCCVAVQQYAWPAPPVRLVRFQPDHFFSPSALTADLGDYDVRGSIDE